MIIHNLYYIDNKVFKTLIVHGFCVLFWSPYKVYCTDPTQKCWLHT